MRSSLELAQNRTKARIPRPSGPQRRRAANLNVADSTGIRTVRSGASIVRDRGGYPEPIAGAWAVVTGASAGIGEQLARQLAQSGHDVVLVARRRDRLELLAAQLRTRYGVSAEVAACDLANRAERQLIVEDLAERRVSLLCNNAGFGVFGDLGQVDPAWQRVQVEVNVNAVHALTFAVLPGMLTRGSGALLFTGSTAGHQPFPGATTYAASKAFVNVFAESLGTELSGTGIRCTLLAPGPVATEFYRTTRLDGRVDAALEMLSLNATATAAQALSGLAAGHRTVVPGVVSNLQTIAGRYMPRGMLLPLLHRIARMLA